MDEKDIAPELLEAIQKDFLTILGDAAVGQQTYIGAAEYADKVGEALAEAFRRNLSSDILPDGKMYWNIADRVVRPMLEEDHRLVAEAAAAVQQALNEAAGIRIKAQEAPLDTDRVEGILNKVAAADQYDDVAWVLYEPVKTFSRSVVDETLRRNVEFQGRSGLSPKIIRRAESKCCEWCSKLAGTYKYPDVPQDVYRRHNNCRCTVEYDPGDGRRQNVWTREWNSEEESAKIEARKQVGAETDYNPKGNIIITEDKQFGKKVGKHAVDFGLDPTKEQDRQRMREIINEILSFPDEIRTGEWRSQPGICDFYIKGNDVVVVNNNRFVTILKDGVSENARIKNAGKQGV